MRLKIKIDLISESTSKAPEELAPFDVVKIRNFLILLILIFGVIGFGIYSLWIKEPVAVSQTSVVKSVEHVTDNVDINAKEVMPEKPDSPLEVNADIEELPLTQTVEEFVEEVKVEEIIVEEVAIKSPIIEEAIVKDTVVENTLIKEVIVEKTAIDDTVFDGVISLDNAESTTNVELAKQPEAIEPEPLPVSINNNVVKRAQLTLGIDDREPVDKVVTLSLASQTKLYLFTQINNKNQQKIYHRWIYKKTVMATIAHNIGSNQWRTYSSKNFDRTMLGSWQVQVIDDTDSVLTVIEFTVTR